MKFKDLTDQRFGRLLVLYRAANNKHGHPVWHCICDCGNDVFASGANLRTGNSESCGCLQKDKARERLSLRPYEALYRLLQRNTRLKDVSMTYEEFLEFTKVHECHYCVAPISWAGNAYNLDRKDNTVGYTIENCVVCCARCNRAKLDHFTYEEWVEIGKVIQTWEK